MSRIKSKEELQFYIAADLMMNRGVFTKNLKMRIKNIILPDYIMAYLMAMRKVDYYKNYKIGGNALLLLIIK